MELPKFIVISRVEAVLYVPVISLTTYLIWKHGLRRGRGWLCLLAYASMRILKSLLFQLIISGWLRGSWHRYVATVNLLGRLEAVPLLWAATAFLSGPASYARQQQPLPEVPLLIRASTLFLLLAFVLEMIGQWVVTVPILRGGVSWNWISPATTALSMIACLGLSTVLVLLHICRNKLSLQHQKALSIISAAYLPLSIRFAYNLGALYAVTMCPFSIWSWLAEDWRTYLVFGVSMEYIAVLMFLVLGFAIPPKQSSIFKHTDLH